MGNPTKKSILSLLQRAPLDLESGCWIYEGKVDHKGTPVMNLDKRTIRLPREVYRFLYGDLPDKCVVTQTCRNKRCVNPEHLKAGLQMDVSPKPNFFRHTVVTLATKTKIDPNTNCWLWQGALSKSGYGETSKDNHTWRAHRLMYTLLHGDIPSGMVIMHQCDTRDCINPEHLSLGTYQDNVTDMMNKGRQVKSRTKTVRLTKDGGANTFNCGRDACEYLGVSVSAISLAAREKKMCRGYKVEYI